MGGIGRVGLDLPGVRDFRKAEFSETSLTNRPFGSESFAKIRRIDEYPASSLHDWSELEAAVPVSPFDPGRGGVSDVTETRFPLPERPVFQIFTAL